MTLIKRNKVWHYQTKIDGKTYRRTTGQTDRRLAEKVARQLQAELRLRKKQPKDWLKLSQAIQREVARIETDISSRQAERALGTFTVFLKWLGCDPAVSEITPEVLEEFQRFRLQSCCLGTVQKDLNFILRLLRQNGASLPKPSAKQGRDNQVRPFTQDELVRLFNHVPDQFRTLYATLLVTGARPAELIPSERSTHKALLKTEVDLEKAVIHLRQAKNRSGKSPRSRPPIPIPDNVLQLLKGQIDQSPAHYPFVFPRIINAWRSFDAILKRAGIAKVDAAGRKLLLHSFRHTYATLMAARVHNNPHFLKSILGHSKITTTDRYCQVEATVIPISEFNLHLTPTEQLTDGTAEIKEVTEARAE